ncbi:MAG: rRNA maturation RNase YbeY [Candidatus Parcubacteria bacterium]|nr:rRNA maturation RNase YbeY [Candidatus Parcubacteria bacterium]
MAIICNFTKKVKTDNFVSKKNVSKALKETAKILKIKDNFEIGVAVVSFAQIRKLNRQYRHKDKVTDVLSFTLQKSRPFITAPAKIKYLGDVVICYQQVKKQAPLFGHSLKQEFTMLICHGFLHLLGYDDKTQKQYQKMALIQDKLLIKLYGQHQATHKKL